MTDALIAEVRGHVQAILPLLDELETTNLLLVEAPEQPVIAAPAPAPAPATNPGFGDEGSFYDWLRDNAMLGPVISPAEFKGCDAITRAEADAQWPLAFAAYGLATAYLETAHQMLPVREAFWLSSSAAAAYFHRMYDPDGQHPEVAKRLGNTRPGDGALYCGRGYPQMTGRTNYAHAAQELGVDLVGHPELALDAVVAAKIMIRGMAEGWFSGRKLADYLPSSGPATLEQFTPARHVINGTDRAADVAGFAINWQKALQAGQWRATWGG